MKKFFAPIFAVALLIALSALVSSCGGSAALAPSTSASFSGTVTDANVSDADVTLYSMKTGEAIGTAKTLSDGSYTIPDVQILDYDSDDAFFIMAVGGTVNDRNVPHLKFKSILGSRSDMETAGSDGTVNATDIPDMTVSNVSTAKVALVEALMESSGGTAFSMEGSSPINATQIAEAIQKESEQESDNLGLVVEIAASIKSAVDNPSSDFTTSLDATNNTALIAKNAITITNGIAKADNLPTDLKAKAQSEGYSDSIKNDTTLMNSASGNTSTTSLDASSINGTTWYGYHTSTWGDPQHMDGPQLFSVTITTSSSTCTSGQILLTISEDDPGTTPQQTETSCATLNGNILTFNVTDTTNKTEVVGTFNTSGTIINGTFTDKNPTTNEVKSGGIFKIGRATSTDNFDGVYTFEGTTTTMYDSNTSTTDIGTSNSISGSITISGSDVTGSSVNELGTTETIQGVMYGPRVQARVSSSSYTTFVVFLINESTVSGLFMGYESVIEDPTDNPNQGGTFKMTKLTKN